MSSNQLIFPNQSYTIELWYKNPGVDGPNGSVENVQIISNYNPGQLSTGIAIRGYAQQNSGHVYFGGSGLDAIYSSSRIDDNQWHHIAGVYNVESGTASLYIDGELNGSANIIDGSYYGTTSTFMVGSGDRVFANDRWMECSIHSIKISNNARYVNNFFPVENLSDDENTIGLWSLEGNNGNIMYDVSGNNYNGTIHGATWTTDYPQPPLPGCTDLYATNYNSEAEIDDGSCSYNDNGDFSLSFDGVDDLLISNSDIPLDGNSEKSLFARFKFDAEPGGIQYIAGWGWDGEGNQPGNQNFSITSLRPGSQLHSETNNLIMWGVGAANVTDIPFNFYANEGVWYDACLLYTSPSPRDAHESRMPSSA